MPKWDNLTCLLPQCIKVDARRTEGNGPSLPFCSPFTGSAMAKIICVGELANFPSLFTKLCLTTIYYSCSSRLKALLWKSSWRQLSRAPGLSKARDRERENQKVSSLLSAARDGWSQVLKLRATVQKPRRENSSDPQNSQVPLWRQPQVRRSAGN